jgi:peptidyl-prolyl cis-trans isomerase SurA
MNKIKIILILVLLLIINTKSYSKENVFIIYDINGELITNIDIKKESNYLVALNDQLKNLDEKKLTEISKESILRETIKKIELNNYFDLTKDNPLVDSYIKDFYRRLKLRDEIEFQKYLQEYGLSINFIRKKIQIEITWQKLIYDKFKNELKINEQEIRKEIESNKDETNEKLYLLSEIVFEIDNQNDLDKKKENINKSIKEIGFKNSANIYSISNSSKFGGEIGWVAEKDLTTKFFDKINSLKIGEHTNPINTGSSFLILKINDVKYEQKITNVDQEINKKIQLESDRQLQKYSKIYYNKVKINTNINEL